MNNECDFHKKYGQCARCGGSLTSSHKCPSKDHIGESNEMIGEQRECRGVEKVVEFAKVEQEKIDGGSVYYRVVVPGVHKQMFIGWGECVKEKAYEAADTINKALTAFINSRSFIAMKEIKMNNSKECEWVEDSNGNWSMCDDNMFVLTDGRPEEHGMKFCCYCGKKIKEIVYRGD